MEALELLVLLPLEAFEASAPPPELLDEEDEEVFFEAAADSLVLFSFFEEPPPELTDSDSDCLLLLVLLVLLPFPLFSGGRLELFSLYPEPEASAAVAELVAVELFLLS